MNETIRKKLAPSLRHLLEQATAQAAQTSLVQAETAQPDERIPERVSVIIRFKGDIADLKAVGLEQASAIRHPDGFSIGEGQIDPMLLGTLTTIPHVISIQEVPEARLLLNYSAREIGAFALRVDPEITGEGVVIGIIDTGIDWRHGAFTKTEVNANGKMVERSRILAIWDQGDDAQDGETRGPDGKTVVYTQEQLNAALETEDRAQRIAMIRAIRGRDSHEGGHGTHVAGIAAGDGSPADCFQCKGGEYVGVAPKADIVVVRTPLENMRIGSALSFIEAQAGSKPLVVNISLGFIGGFGGRDGTHPIEQIIDGFVASRPGRIVVAAAGNSGNEGRHSRVIVPAFNSGIPGSGVAEIKLDVYPGDMQTRGLDFWYPDGHELNVEVIAPGGARSGIVHHGTSLPAPFVVNPAAPVLERMAVRIEGTASHWDNGDNNFQIFLHKPVRAQLLAGEWTLRFTNPNAASVELHGWILASAPAEQEPPKPPTFRSPTAETTLCMPATAAGAITVANYQGRREASDCFPKGNIHASSSMGPVRRDADRNQKPDLAAPGEGITSAMANSYVLPGELCDCCPEGLCLLYRDLSGTSMAAPHVAGAVALMLQVEPNLTQEMVVWFLKASTQPPPAGADPNAWGAGLLDVKKAVELVKEWKAANGGSTAPILPTVATPVRAASASENAQRASSRPVNSLVNALRTRARTIPDGELCAAIISRHFSEARRLINTNKRVATMWHRGDGPRLIRRLMVGALDASAAAPILGDEQREYLGRLLEQLKRYGSLSLRASIERYGDKVIQLLERPMAAQVASQSTQVKV